MEKTVLKPYVLILIAVIGMIASSIGIVQNAAGVFFLPMSQSLGLGMGALAFSATLTNLLTGFSSPIAMRLLKRYSFVHVMRLGIVGASLATLGMAFSTQLWQFYTLAIIRGFSSSFFALAPVVYLIGNWFEAKQGLAMGLAMSFTGIFGAILSPVLNQVIQVTSWQMGYVVVSILIMLTAFTGTFWLQVDPKQSGHKAYGASSISHPSEGVIAQKPAFNGFFWLLVSFTLLTATLTGLVQHFPSYSLTIGLSSTTGALMVSSAMLGNVVFKLIIGSLSDKFGSIKAISTIFIINSCALVGFLSFQSLAHQTLLIVLAFMMGSIYANVAVGTPLLTKTFYSKEQAPTVYAYLTSFVSVGGASAIYIFGLLYDIFGHYQYGLWALVMIQMTVITLFYGLVLFRKNLSK